MKAARVSGDSPWWQINGVQPLAVYQPKGAASLAASYVNISSSGTNNAAPGVAPTFSTADGWTFNGTTQYLDTGLVPPNDQSWSMFIRFSDSSGDSVCVGGLQSPPGSFGLYCRTNSETEVIYMNSNTAGSSVSPAMTSGVLGVSGNRGYRNGVTEGSDILAEAGPITISIFLGALNFQGVAASFCPCKIQAVWISQSSLTAPQALSLATRMANL